MKQYPEIRSGFSSEMLGAYDPKYVGGRLSPEYLN